MPSDPGLDPLAGRKVLILVSEDWYFCSHRLPVGRALREAGADVVVVSPRLSASLASLAVRGVIQYQPRPFTDDDVLGCALVIGATNQHASTCEASCLAY